MLFNFQSFQRKRIIRSILSVLSHIDIPIIQFFRIFIISHNYVSIAKFTKILLK